MVSVYFGSLETLLVKLSLFCCSSAEFHIVVTWFKRREVGAVSCELLRVLEGGAAACHPGCDYCVASRHLTWKLRVMLTNIAFISSHKTWSWSLQSYFTLTAELRWTPLNWVYYLGYFPHSVHTQAKPLESVTVGEFQPRKTSFILVSMGFIVSQTSWPCYQAGNVLPQTSWNASQTIKRVKNKVGPNLLFRLKWEH